MNAILPLYEELLKQLATAGAEWVQIDEPCLCFDLDHEAGQFYRHAYAKLIDAPSLPKFMLATYFGDSVKISILRLFWARRDSILTWYALQNNLMRCWKKIQAGSLSRLA